MNTTTLRHERKKSLLLMLYNVLDAGPKLARNILTNFSPSTARLRTLHHVKSFILRVLLAQRHKNIFEIKSKCTTVNWQKSTKFHLQHEKNVQRNQVWWICKANVSHLDESVAALWTSLNSSRSDDLQTNAFSTSAKCTSQGKYIFRICWSPLSRHYRKLG